MDSTRTGLSFTKGPFSGAQLASWSRCRGFFEEALEEAHQSARDLVPGVDRETLAGPLGLSGPERTDEGDVAAALRGDDRAVPPAPELELDPAQGLAVDPN